MNITKVTVKAIVETDGKWDEKTQRYSRAKVEISGDKEMVIALIEMLEKQ